MDIRKQERIQEIYNRNSDMVYRICYLYLKNEQDAYDVTHETFIRLILREPEFSSREAERAWLIRVAVNCCRDMLKSWWRSNWNGREAMEDQRLPRQETEKMQHSPVLEAVEQLGDVYKDTEESWVYEGIRYTLNGYWYDRENGYAMAEIGIETVDGSPFLDWGEAYEMLEESDWQESEFFEAYPDADAWREACAGGEESYETYGRMADEAGVFLQTRFSDAWYRSGAVSVVYGSDHTADCFLADSFVFGQDGQMLENFQLELVTGKGQVVGTYQMEDTGALPIAVVRCPELLGGDRMEFSGAGFLLRLEAARRIGFELETLQVVLRDGTEYCYDVHADDRQEEADQTGEADWEKSGELEYFREGEKNFTSLGYMESLTVGLYCYSGTLEDYIDVHEIASVTLNGVSCTIEVVQPEG